MNYSITRPKKSSWKWKKIYFRTHFTNFNEANEHINKKIIAPQRSKIFFKPQLLLKQSRVFFYYSQKFGPLKKVKRAAKKGQQFKFRSSGEAAVPFRTCKLTLRAASTCRSWSWSWTSRSRRCGSGGWRGSRPKWPRLPSRGCPPSPGWGRWTCHKSQHLNDQTSF